jgi:chromosomal replication initiator protein
MIHTQTMTRPTLQRTQSAQIYPIMGTAIHTHHSMICEPKKDSISDIEKVVCDYFGVKCELLHSKSRKREIVKPRQIICYMIRKHYPNENSLCAIGDYFDQDHTTILHSCNTVQDLIDYDHDYRLTVQAIESTLK